MKHRVGLSLQKEHMQSCSDGWEGRWCPMLSRLCESAVEVETSGSSQKTGTWEPLVTLTPQKYCLRGVLKFRRILFYTGGCLRRSLILCGRLNILVNSSGESYLYILSSLPHPSYIPSHPPPPTNHRRLTVFQT